MILFGNTFAKISALKLILEYEILPERILDAVLTSIRNNFLSLRIAKSHEHDGLKALKTSYFFLSKSIATISSLIAPVVAVERIGLGLRERYLSFAYLSLQKWSQYLTNCQRAFVPSIILLQYRQRFSSIVLYPFICPIIALLCNVVNVNIVKDPK